MGRHVVILPGALSDMDEAAEFYDDQEPGLGVVVYEFLKQKSFHLSAIAGLHPSHRGVHKWVVPGRFPYYLMYYRLEGEVVTLSAILDGRRNPDHNRRLLEERL